MNLVSISLPPLSAPDEKGVSYRMLKVGENNLNRLAQLLAVPLGLRALLEVGGLFHIFMLSTFPGKSQTWEAITLSTACNRVTVILGTVFRPT